MSQLTKDLLWKLIVKYRRKTYDWKISRFKI